MRPASGEPQNVQVPELPLATLEAPALEPALAAAVSAPISSGPTLVIPTLLEPVPAEPVLAPPVSTSTSSASLRAVELPRSGPAEHPATDPAPLPVDELRRVATAAQPAAERVATKKARPTWALWGASLAAVATLVFALGLRSGGSVVKRPQSASSQVSLPVVARQNTANTPRTEAAIAASPVAESAPGAPSVAPAPASVGPEPVPSVAAAATGETSTAAAPAPAAYDQKALEGALHWGVTQAEACHREGRPTGTARATMTFAPNGKVSDFVLEGEPIASAPVSKCISSYLRAVMIPPFSGAAFTITREITLR